MGMAKKFKKSRTKGRKAADLEGTVYHRGKPTEGLGARHQKQQKNAKEQARQTTQLRAYNKTTKHTREWQSGKSSEAESFQPRFIRSRRREEKKKGRASALNNQRKATECAARGAQETRQNGWGGVGGMIDTGRGGAGK